MNVNNVIRSLRQSLKLQPISVYCAGAQPSITANRVFFNEVIPTLKLLLRAFKQAGFVCNLSRWGELTLFSQELGIDVFLRLEQNTSYMSSVSSSALERNGYDVVDIYSPHKPFVLKYYFCGTKAKWRQIPFELTFTTVESVHAALIRPILDESKSFRSRLKTAIADDHNPNDLDTATIYAFARYATTSMSRVYGWANICQTFESEYVRQCFVGRYGALLFTDQWHGVKTVCWQRNDAKFIERYLPEIITPYQIVCVSVRSILPLDKEHKFLLEVIDKALLMRFGNMNKVEFWLGENQYFADKRAPKLLLSNVDGTLIVLSHAIRQGM